MRMRLFFSPLTLVALISSTIDCIAPWQSDNQIVSIPLVYDGQTELSIASGNHYLFNYNGYRIRPRFWLPALSDSSTPSSIPADSQTLDCYLDMGYSYVAVQEMRGCCSANSTSCLPKDQGFCLFVNSSLVTSSAVSPIDPSSVTCLSQTGGSECSTPQPLQCEWTLQGVSKMVLPKLQLLDLFSVNYSVSAFRRSFNWDNYQKASTPMTCRLGLFDPAGYGGTSLLGEWLSYATSGNRIIMLDLNADSQLNSQRNLLYLRGLPATLSTKMVWGERRLDFWRCMSNAYLSVYSFSIAGYQLGQGVNDGFNGNAIVSLSLSRQYLSLPDILFKEIIQVLPVDCSAKSSDYFCKLNVTNLGQLDTTFVTFRISAEGQVLGLPLSRLVKWESASLYLAVSSEPEVPESLSPSLGDFEIVFGQQMIESFYVAFDLETKRFGFANKLVSDDINLNDTSAALPINNSAINNSITEARKRELACSSNMYRSYNVAAQNCDTSLNTKFFHVLFALGMFAAEVYAWNGYRQANKHLATIAQ